MKWLNEPREWHTQGGNLSFVTEDKTDFWQVTRYGWRNDNGHFYAREVEGDFTAEVAFLADYRAQYDQAGLMLRYGPEEWIKAGVEFAHGRAVVSAVYTQGLSDWAIGPEVPVAGTIHLRLMRKGNAVCVQWMETGKFETLRLGAFSGKGAAMVGPMACSPVQGGLDVRFENFRVGPAVDFASEV